MIYNTNDIRKLLLSKGYKLKGNVIHTKDNETFNANLGVSDASFRLITPSGVYDFSEDWINLLLKTYPQEETFKEILDCILREKFVTTEQIHRKLEILKDEKAKEQFKRTIRPGEIKPGQCIYGLNEIGLICAHFGKESDIYKAMANGREVSKMIEKSIQEQLADIENKKRLLKMCKERENLIEESQTPTL